MFDVYLNENPLILTRVELKIIKDNFIRKELIENHFLKYKSNKFYIEKNMPNKFRKIQECSNPGKRLINIEINYLEDIKLCKLTHKIEMPEEEFIKMIEDDDKDFEIKLKEIEKN
uniref:CYTH domain-containing protein n=1 Tax=Meloidogyne floridensis TaxID=298350 RepID=A0A915P720_9BILA